MTQLQFPKGFLWGTATSSHQVEGHTHNNWSEWERQHAERLARESEKKFAHLPNWLAIQAQAQDPTNYISSLACDHYRRFEEDFDIVQSLGHNTHRFSLEWARIEPEEGKFDESAIAHYREVLTALKKRNITPFVTLWHWTHPLWLEEKGGLEHENFPTYFTHYAEHVVSQLKDLATFWITLNEPTSVIGAAYLNGNWPPQKKSFRAALRVYRQLAKAHNLSFYAIHKIQPEARVGFANILQSFVPYRKKSLIDRLSVRVAKFFTNEYMLLLTHGRHDFLTVQYYFHSRLKFIRRTHNKDHAESDLGWEIYPEGIYHIIKDLAHHRLPIYITENGLADADDSRREIFIKEHLFWIHKAIQESIDVRGYFYWSLLDNFEWDKGFWPRFGLVEVDYATQKRTIRPSALAYAEICKKNTLEIEMS
jgi:beta-glucosidase